MIFNNDITATSASIAVGPAASATTTRMFFENSSDTFPFTCGQAACHVTVDPAAVCFGWAGGGGGGGGGGVATGANAATETLQASNGAGQLNATLFLNNLEQFGCQGPCPTAQPGGTNFPGGIGRLPDVSYCFMGSGSPLPRVQNYSGDASGVARTAVYAYNDPSGAIAPVSPYNSSYWGIIGVSGEMDASGLFATATGNTVPPPTPGANAPGPADQGNWNWTEYRPGVGMPGGATPPGARRTNPYYCNPAGPLASGRGGPTRTNRENPDVPGMPHSFGGGYTLRGGYTHPLCDFPILRRKGVARYWENPWFYGLGASPKYGIPGSGPATEAPNQVARCYCPWNTLNNGINEDNAVNSGQWWHDASGIFGEPTGIWARAQALSKDASGGWYIPPTLIGSSNTVNRSSSGRDELVPAKSLAKVYWMGGK